MNKGNYGVYGKYLVSNEKFFNPRLRTPKEEYKKVLDDDSSLILLLFNNNFVGHALGYRSKDGSFYVFSVLVVPKFRSKGYGRILFDRLLFLVKQRGYKSLTGHFNSKSIKLLPDKASKKIKRSYKGYRFVKMRINL